MLTKATVSCTYVSPAACKFRPFSLPFFYNSLTTAAAGLIFPPVVSVSSAERE